ncbi:MAG: Glu/Leu/Phe/Val dehydrogenase dimerization domain-containing protein [Pseudomonadota bacterium]
MFTDAAFDNHERVEFSFDADTGLRTIIAIHSTALGPAAGGCRLWEYNQPEEALHDALRLSKGMSFKNAVAELPFGGGKAVILGPVKEHLRAQVFEAFGRTVQRLSGAYFTAEDVGVSVSDMESVARNTKFVSGLKRDKGSAGGDPSPFTARGVLKGIEAAATIKFGRSDLEGLKIAVQGLGGVGGNLCRLLAKCGVSLVVADINKDVVDKTCQETGAERADISEILYSDVDVLSPCALGGVLTSDNVKKIRAKIVAGGANNQMASIEVGQQLFDKGILYAPDYVINAGGIITVAAEYQGANRMDDVLARIDYIRDRVTRIFEQSMKTGTPTHILADNLARNKIAMASR